MHKSKSVWGTHVDYVCFRVRFMSFFDQMMDYGEVRDRISARVDGDLETKNISPNLRFLGMKESMVDR